MGFCILRLLIAMKWFPARIFHLVWPMFFHIVGMISLCNNLQIIYFFRANSTIASYKWWLVAQGDWSIKLYSTSYSRIKYLWTIQIEFKIDLNLQFLLVLCESNLRKSGQSCITIAALLIRL